MAAASHACSASAVAPGPNGLLHQGQVVGGGHRPKVAALGGGGRRSGIKELRRRRSASGRRQGGELVGTGGRSCSHLLARRSASRATSCRRS